VNTKRATAAKNERAEERTEIEKRMEKSPKCNGIVYTAARKPEPHRQYLRFQVSAAAAQNTNFPGDNGLPSQKEKPAPCALCAERTLSQVTCPEVLRISVSIRDAVCSRNQHLSFRSNEQPVETTQLVALI
jgi:hypothetical protein